ncbi:MAG: efflux RND transporter periplasmic adaptor subunit [Chitinophagales bacterium]|nr:efflux RND transporter periplasmic adaptor subunit [Chitinophagales bacterium]
MKQRALIWILLLLLTAVAVWKLFMNKQQLDTKAELSRLQRAFVPVEVVQPQLETLANHLEADGIFLASKEMFVISETAGRVLETYKNKGEWLQEGEIIAKVDDELLRIELEATQANLAKLRKDRERLNNLIEGEAAPKNKIEDLELGILAAEAKEKGLKKQISNTSIKAPMTGTLGMRFIERGSVIGPGIQIGQMTNLEKLFLMVKVTERDVLNVKKGQLVSVRADVFPDMNIPGKVTNIGLRADNAFTYDVEIEVVNPKGNPLRGGMHAKAKFTFDANRQGYTLPRKVIAGSLQDPKVYVVQGDTMAVLRAITLGSVYGDKIEVSTGVQPSEKVVVTGQLNLVDGARVSVVK